MPILHWREVLVHFGSRRNCALKGAAATGIAAAGLPLFAARPATADDGGGPNDSGRPGRRYYHSRRPR